MTTTSKLAFGTLIAALGGPGTLPANAQDEAVGASTEMATEPTPEEAEAATEEAAAKEDPMGWFGIGLKLGVQGIGSGDFERDITVGGVTQTLKIDSPSRTGFHMAVPIYLGGDGFGFNLEPFINFSSGAFESGGIKGDESDFTAFGMYLGPKFDIHILDPLYVGFGFGLKAAWVSSDDLDYGADLYGRIPIQATYYLLNDLGLTAEFGFGYGVSGYLGKKDPSDPDPEINFGKAFIWDFTVGVRWP